MTKAQRKAIEGYKKGLEKTPNMTYVEIAKANKKERKWT